MDINKKDLSEKLIIDIMNLWCYKEAPVYVIKGTMPRSQVHLIVRGILFGDEAIFSHEKINEILNYLKNEGLIKKDKNIYEIIQDGKLNAHGEIRKAMNDPEVLKSLEDMLNTISEVVIGKTKNEDEDEILYANMGKYELNDELNKALENNDMDIIKEITKYL